MAATEREIEELYRSRYMRFVNGTATLAGSREAARDVVQEGFARALARRDDFREGSLEAWVWTITLRVALDQRRRGLRILGLRNGHPDPALPEPERDPELAAAVRALPPKRRTVVFLRYFADLTHAEIAQVLGLSEGTVAATLSQARATLRAALTREEESA